MGSEGGQESSLLLSLGKGGKVAMLGVDLLPPVQGNQCWYSLKVVFERNMAGGEQQAPGKVSVLASPVLQELQMCPTVVTDTRVRK